MGTFDNLNTSSDKVEALWILCDLIKNNNTLKVQDEVLPLITRLVKSIEG